MVEEAAVTVEVANEVAKDVAVVVVVEEDHKEEKGEDMVAESVEAPLP